MRSRLAAVLVAMPLAAFADEAGIHIDHAWSRAAISGHEGVVYLTITDTGAEDTLTGVTTPVAAEAALHQSIDDHGVMKIRPAGPLPVEPGKPVTLAPGGYHIMLMGLKQTLKLGDRFPVTLTESCQSSHHPYTSRPTRAQPRVTHFPRYGLQAGLSLHPVVASGPPPAALGQRRDDKSRKWGDGRP